MSKEHGRCNEGPRNTLSSYCCLLDWASSFISWCAYTPGFVGTRCNYVCERTWSAATNHTESIDLWDVTLKKYLKYSRYLIHGYISMRILQKVCGKWNWKISWFRCKNVLKSMQFFFSRIWIFHRLFEDSM